MSPDELQDEEDEKKKKEAPSLGTIFTHLVFTIEILLRRCGNFAAPKARADHFMFDFTVSDFIFTALKCGCAAF